MIKVITWNVNSIRKRLEQLLSLLKSENIDIALLQETKCRDSDFPEMEIQSAGYHCYIFGQKAFNGVAIVSRQELTLMHKNLPIYHNHPDARYIECLYKNINISSIYVPNGQEVDSTAFHFKLDFLDQLSSHMSSIMSSNRSFIIGGDYNVAPHDIDVHSPKSLNGTTCFHPEERMRFKSILNLGIFDAFRLKNPHLQKFSWWDYRGGGFRYNKGMRLDHILVTPSLADRMIECNIMEHVRTNAQPSDHAPCMMNLR